MFTKIAGDRLFTIIVIVLVVGGLAMFASASLGLLARAGESPWHIAVSQVFLGLIPGVIALIFLRFLSPKLLMRAIVPLYIGSILLTLFVFIPHLGFHTNGATRWIQLGPVTIQPAEFLKIAVILMFAAYLSQAKTRIKEYRYGLGMFALIVGIPSLILIAQPNNSTMLIIGTTCAALYFLAGAKLRDFAILFAVALIGLTLILATHSYTRQRIMTFIHPAQSSLSTGYQIQQSLMLLARVDWWEGGTGKACRNLITYQNQTETHLCSIRRGVWIPRYDSSYLALHWLCYARPHDCGRSIDNVWLPCRYRLTL